MTVRIIANDKGNPVGKLADAELQFEEGPLAGLKLVGSSLWSRRTGGGFNVVFPARSYQVSGERRTSSLLRPISDTSAQDSIRAAILTAYVEWEVAQAAA